MILKIDIESQERTGAVPHQRGIAPAFCVSVSYLIRPPSSAGNSRKKKPRRKEMFSAARLTAFCYSVAALNCVHAFTWASSASALMFSIISIWSAVKSSGRVRNSLYSSEISSSAALLVQ